MKQKIFLGIFLVVMSLLAACGGSTGGTTTHYTVTMGGVSFNSSSITISKGSSVTFTTEQGGTAHNLVNGTSGQAHVEQGVPSFGSGGQAVAPGKSWTTDAWNTAGTFHVTCTLHPTTMTLTVVVTG